MSVPDLRPRFSALEIKANYSCNSACVYCCAGNRSRQRAMTFDEIAANIEFFIKTYGIEEVCMSGGEPTVHRDFLTTLAFIRSKKLRTYLHTNAIRLHDRELAQKCAGLIRRTLVGFSFHTPELCAELAGSAKTFQQRTAGIANLLEASVPLRTNTVILKQNYRHLPEIAELVRSFGVRRSLLTFPFFFECSDAQVGRFVPESLEAVRPFLDAAVDILLKHGIEVSLQGLPPCRLGDLKTFREKDPDRAFVDSAHQLENHSMLFSTTLGYAKDDRCRDCEFNDSECWGFPKPGALGVLGAGMELPDQYLRKP